MELITFLVGLILFYGTVLRPWLQARKELSYAELSHRLDAVKIAALKRRYPSLRSQSPESIKEQYDIHTLYYSL